MSRTTENCPHCEEPLPTGAGFCKACGFDLDSDPDPDDGDPDGPEDFDYERFLESEGLRKSPVNLWLGAAVLLAVIAAIYALVRDA